MVAASLSGCLDVSVLRDCQSPWLCEDFEAPLDSRTWTLGSPDPGVTGVLDGVQVHSGKQALHLELSVAKGATAQWIMFWPKLPATPSAHYYFRAFTRVSTNTADNVQLLNLRTSGTGNPTHLFVSNRGLSLSTEAGGSVDSTTAFPLGRWVCLEWEVQQAPAGLMKASVDGAVVASFEGRTTLSTGMLGDRLGVGATVNNASAPMALSVFFDDLVVAERPVGCDLIRP